MAQCIPLYGRNELQGPVTTPFVGANLTTEVTIQLANADRQKGGPIEILTSRGIRVSFLFHWYTFENMGLG